MSGSAEVPLAETVFEDEPVDLNSRDRIVILGRRASGKTVYLSVLYERYWRSLNGVTMRALSGNVHSDLVRVADGLRSGRWPPATLDTQYCDLEIEYGGTKQMLVALDYAGELFRRAFVEDRTDTPETAELVKHIDAAAAVILLIDPSIVVRGNVDAAIDDDFGMTQAVTRIRNWPGGRDIPFVVAFTKADVNRPLIHEAGGPAKFVAEHFPALARTLKKVQIFQVSAVQVYQGNDGELLPRPGSSPWQVEKPLLYCLDQIESVRRRAAEQKAFESRIRLKEQMRIAAAKAEKRSNRLVALLALFLIAVGICLAALIWAYRT